MRKKRPISRSEYLFIRENVGNIHDSESLVSILDAFRRGLFHYKEPITKERLLNLAKSSPEVLYRDVIVPKKDKGSRTLSIPCDNLKEVQKCLAAFFKFRKLNRFPGVGCGWVELSNLSSDDANPTEVHKSIFSHFRGGILVAKVHAGSEVVYNMDIENFFGSITSERIILSLTQKTTKNSFVRGALQLNYKVALLISRLVTKKTAEGIRVLPQGAPTSSIIANLVVSHLDDRLVGYSERHGLNYSRYADDITFSCSRKEPWATHKSFFEKIIETEGFKPNMGKSRVSFQYQRQAVTGIVVNSRPNLPGKFIKDLRTLIHNWELDGYVTANNKMLVRHMGRSDFDCSKKLPRIEYVVAGKLAYLKMVRGADALWTKLHERYKALRDRDYCIITGKATHKNNHRYYRYGDDVGPLVHAVRDDEHSSWRIIEVKNQGRWMNAGEDYARRLRYPDLPIENLPF